MEYSFFGFLKKTLHSESLSFNKISEYSSKCLEKSIRKKMFSTREYTKKNDTFNVANCAQLLLIHL